MSPLCDMTVTVYRGKTRLVAGIALKNTLKAAVLRGIAVA